VEGPYRDLGAGFARLTGTEGARRAPRPLRCVEDALLELLRNSRDAGATRVFVASTLRSRRYRILTVLDDGEGIPETHADLIFEPGVTTRHLRPVPDPAGPHGAGLALYHIRNVALRAEVLSTSSPTSIKIAFDTRTFPERSLQSSSRPSRTNLRATLEAFARDNRLTLHYGPPASILATLLRYRIIQPEEGAGRLWQTASALGLEVSLRTVQRVLRGEREPLGRVAGERKVAAGRQRGGREDGPVLALGEQERASIADILRRAARASYLEVEGVTLESRPGEVHVRARVYEPEEEYE
jgi:hypothetical protein